MSPPLGIRWDWGPGQSRFGVTSGGRLVELSIHHPGLLLGSAFRGRIARVEPALDAAFVDLGLGGPPGFLPGAKALGLSEGMSVPVRVRAEAVAGKGARLAHAPDLEGAAHRPGPLEYLLALYPDISEVVVNDAAALAEAKALFPAARLDREMDLGEAVDEALEPVVPLACGGRLIMERTAALWAVDVDSGPARPAQANAQAAEAIARQLRLRGIGGQVVVDFVSGPKGTEFKLAAALKRAVSADPTPTHVFGVSKLGLVELVRERRGLSLAETLCAPASLRLAPETVALAALRRLLAEAAARPGARLRLALPPEAASSLARLDEAAAETARRLGYKPEARVDAALAPEDIRVEEG